MSNQVIKQYFILILFFLVSYFAFGQSINIIQDTFNQRSLTYSIRYTVKKYHFKKLLIVKPYYTINKDTIFVQNAYGDWGEVAKKTGVYELFWDPFKSGLDNLSNIEFKMQYNSVKAKQSDKWGLAWSGDYISPLGFKLYRFVDYSGLFISTRFGALPPSYKYSANIGGLRDYRELGVYEITSNTKLASYKITVGAILHVDRLFSLFLGIGYGTKQEFWQYDEFNLDNEFIAHRWALNENNDFRGLIFDSGITFRKKRIFAELGVTTLEKLSSLSLLTSFGVVF